MNSFQSWLRGKALALAIVTTAVSFAVSDPNEATFSKRAVEKKPTEAIQSLKVGSYNLLNLFEEGGKIFNRDEAHLFSIFPEKSRPMEEPLKSLRALRAQAKIILENDYDVMAVEEVENLKALSALSEQFLDGKYDAYLIEGNDPRGIDVGFLVKSGLPFEVEQRTHQDETWNDPTQDGKVAKLFSRDLPSLIFRLEKKEKPAFVFFGTHFKSKRDRPSDSESRILRQAQVERTSEILVSYEKEFGSETPIFLAGDFNGEIAHEKEFEALKRVASLADSFDVVEPPLSKDERVTHTYFPKDGHPKFAQLDAVMVNSSAEKFINDAKVARYQDSSGNELPIPKSFKDVKKNPSDHFPVQAEIDFQKLAR
jgi:predicted extracellular nuclease